MDRIKEKMNSLRLEADENAAKVEELQGKLKSVEQENLAKDQTITSLEHNKGLLEDRVEKLEGEVKDLKTAAAEGQQQGTQAETLARRLQLLEEEAEEADKTLREANEKIRQLDIQLGHEQRKAQASAANSDQWEAKYEEVVKKHTELQKDMENLTNEIGNI